jgi:hypothetical protein
MAGETILRMVWMAFVLASAVLLAVHPTRAQLAPGADFAADFAQDDPASPRGKVYYSHGILRINLPESRFGDERREVLLTSWREYRTYRLLPDSRQYTIEEDSLGQLGIFAPLPDPEHPCSVLISRIRANFDDNCEKTGSGRFLNRSVAIWTIHLPVMTSFPTTNIPFNDVNYLVDFKIGILLQEKSPYRHRELTNLELKPQPPRLFEIPAGYHDASGNVLAQPLRPDFDDQPQFDADLVSPEGHSLLNVGHGKIRIVFNSYKPILIADLASHRTFLVNPDGQTFQDEGASFDDFFQFLLPLDPRNPCGSPQLVKKSVTCTKTGSELLNGRFADKWEWSTNGAAGGTFWIDPELQFPVKDVRSGGTYRELYYIREGPQPPQVFEIPPPYRNAHPPEGKTVPLDKHPAGAPRN